jgi:hypothetical protein
MTPSPEKKETDRPLFDEASNTFGIEHLHGMPAQRRALERMVEHASTALDWIQVYSAAAGVGYHQDVVQRGEAGATDPLIAARAVQELRARRSEISLEACAYIRRTCWAPEWHPEIQAFAKEREAELFAQGAVISEQSSDIVYLLGVLLTAEGRMNMNDDKAKS